MWVCRGVDRRCMTGSRGDRVVGWRGEKGGTIWRGESVTIYFAQQNRLEMSAQAEQHKNSSTHGIRSRHYSSLRRALRRTPERPASSRGSERRAGCQLYLLPLYRTRYTLVTGRQLRDKRNALPVNRLLDHRERRVAPSAGRLYLQDCPLHRRRRKPAGSRLGPDASRCVGRSLTTGTASNAHAVVTRAQSMKNLEPAPRGRCGNDSLPPRRRCAHACAYITCDPALRCRAPKVAPKGLPRSVHSASVHKPPSL